MGKRDGILPLRMQRRVERSRKETFMITMSSIRCLRNHHRMGSLEPSKPRVACQISLPQREMGKGRYDLQTSPLPVPRFPIAPELLPKTYIAYLLSLCNNMVRLQNKSSADFYMSYKKHGKPPRRGHYTLTFTYSYTNLSEGSPWPVFFLALLDSEAIFIGCHF